MDAEASPRVNKELLSQYVGKSVSLVGRVVNSSPQCAIIEASDGGVVNVIPSPESDYSSTYVEVIGRVMNDTSIQEYKCTNFKDQFDMKNYDLLVQLINGRYQDLFLKQ